MDVESQKAPHTESLLDTGEAIRLPRTSRGHRRSLRADARRRRFMANVMFVCSSVVAIAVVGICYALLAQ